MKKKESRKHKKKVHYKYSSNHLLTIICSIIVFSIFFSLTMIFLSKSPNETAVFSAATQQTAYPTFYCLGTTSCDNNAIKTTQTPTPTFSLQDTSHKTSVSKQINTLSKQLKQKNASASATLKKCEKKLVKKSWYKRALNYIYGLFCKYFGKYCSRITSNTSVTTTCKITSTKSKPSPTPNNKITTTPTVTSVLSISPTMTATNNPTQTTTPTSSPTPTITNIPTLTTTPAFTNTPTPTIQQAATIPETAGDIWGGYVYSLGSSPTNSKIEGSWNVAHITCTSGTSSISPWIGFGGANATDQDIAQLGFDYDCSSGTPVYSLWTEAYPANSVYYSNDTIAEGDEITASVTYQGNGSFTTTISDPKQGWTQTTPMSFSNTYTPESGEYILERLKGGNGIPQFAPQIFSNSYVTPNGTSKQPLSNASNLQNFYLSNNGTKESTNSQINGSTFTITFVAR